MQTQNMYELAEQLKQLREKKKNAEQRLKEMNAEIEQADYQLSMLMAETETQNFTRAGTMFALTTKIRASAVAGRKEELYAALKENGWSMKLSMPIVCLLLSKSRSQKIRILYQSG